MADPRIVASAGPVGAQKPRQTVHTQFAMENGQGVLLELLIVICSKGIIGPSVVNKTSTNPCSAQARCKASNAPYPSASNSLQLSCFVSTSTCSAALIYWLFTSPTQKALTLSEGHRCSEHFSGITACASWRSVSTPPARSRPSISP
jgi:hypothetical protein